MHNYNREKRMYRRTNLRHFVQLTQKPDSNEGWVSERRVGYKSGFFLFIEKIGCERNEEMLRRG